MSAREYAKVLTRFWTEGSGKALRDSDDDDGRTLARSDRPVVAIRMNQATADAFVRHPKVREYAGAVASPWALPDSAPSKFSIPGLPPFRVGDLQNIGPDEALVELEV